MYTSCSIIVHIVLDNISGNCINSIVVLCTSDIEYEYEIDASNGTVLEKNIEQFQIQTNPTDSAINSSGNDYIGVDRAKEIDRLKNGDCGDKNVKLPVTLIERDSVHFLFNYAINSSGNDYIGVDRAKEIALNHAQLNESDVQFAKAKLENDDGGVEYEIELRGSEKFVPALTTIKQDNRQRAALAVNLLNRGALPVP